MYWTARAPLTSAVRSIVFTDAARGWAVGDAGTILAYNETRPIAKLTVKCNKKSARIGTQVTLSGLCKSTESMAGEVIHVQVKKPGQRTWSRLSDRVARVGTSATTASWQYKYTLKRGMRTGDYQFRAMYDGPDFSNAASTACHLRALSWR